MINDKPLIFWYTGFGKPNVMLPCAIRSSIDHCQTISLSSSLPVDVVTLLPWTAWTCMMHLLHLSLYLLVTHGLIPKSDPDLLEKILGPLLAVQTAPLAITLTAPMLDRYSIGDLKKCKKVISENGSHMFPLCFNLFPVSVNFMTYGHCASL